MLIDIDIIKIVNLVWYYAQPFFEFFQALGLSMLGLIIVIELIKSAWDLATGSGWHFSRTLLHMIVLGVILSTYVVICKELWIFGGLQTIAAVNDGGKTFDFTVADIGRDSLKTLEALIMSFTVQNMSSSWMGPLSIIGPAFLKMAFAVILFPIVGILLILINIVVYLIIFGHFIGFLVLLLSGFVFIPFLLSSDLRQVFITWLNNLIVYIVTFLSFRLAITICAFLNSYQRHIFVEEFLRNSEAAYVFTLLFIPLAQLLVMWKVPSMVRSIIGYGGGAGGGEFAAGGAGLTGGLLYGASRVRMLRPRR